MPENQKGRGTQGDTGRGSQEGSHGSSQRGLASADKETRQRVAREGGKASHGGGRKKESGKGH